MYPAVVAVAAAAIVVFTHRPYNNSEVFKQNLELAQSMGSSSSRDSSRDSSTGRSLFDRISSVVGSNNNSNSNSSNSAHGIINFFLFASLSITANETLVLLQLRRAEAAATGNVVPR